MREREVPWHYKSGQSPDGEKPWEKFSKSSTMTLQIRAIPRRWRRRSIKKYWYHDITNPGNPQTGAIILAAKADLYHDITNPGNPQTLCDRKGKPKTKVPWHYKSGQSPDNLAKPRLLFVDLYHDITNPGNPQTTKAHSTKFESHVPWHYKSGQSPDMATFFTGCHNLTYHDITNPGNPQTPFKKHINYW